MANDTPATQTFPWACPVPDCNFNVTAFSVKLLESEVHIHSIWHDRQHAEYAAQSRQDNPVRGGNGAVRKRGNWDDVKLFTVTQYPKHSIPMSEWKEFVKSAKTNISCYGLGENSSATKSEVKGRVEALQNDLMTEVTDTNVTLDALLEKMKVMMTKELLWERECNKFMQLKMQEGEKCAEFHERIQRQLDLTGLKTCNSCNTLDQLKKVLATQRIFDTALQKEVMSRSGILKSSYLQTATWTDTKDKVRQLEDDYTIDDEEQNAPRVAAVRKTAYKRQCKICKEIHKTETCRKMCRLEKCSSSKPHKYSREHHREVDPLWGKKKNQTHTQPSASESEYEEEQPTSRRRKTAAAAYHSSHSSDDSPDYSSARLVLNSAGRRAHKIWDQTRRTTRHSKPWRNPRVRTKIGLATEPLAYEGVQPAYDGKMLSAPAIVDTGANVCTIGRKMFHELGAEQATIPANAQLRMADGRLRAVKEATWVRLTVDEGGKTRSTTQMAYIVNHNNHLCLSHEASVLLGQVEGNWDRWGQRRPRPSSHQTGSTLGSAITTGETGSAIGRTERSRRR